MADGTMRDVYQLPWENDAGKTEESIFSAISDIFDESPDTENAESADADGNPTTEQPKAETEGTPEAAAEDGEVEAEADDQPSDDADREELDEEESDEEAIELSDESLIQIGDETLQVRELREGRLRQADYTRKTQELAEQRRALDEELAGRRLERTQYREALDHLEGIIQASHNTEDVDWDAVRAEYPDEYPVWWADHQRRVEALKEVEAERVRVDTERLHEEAKAFIEKVPEWNDPQKYVQGTQELLKNATTYGFTEPELRAALRDHRLMLLLKDAAAYKRSEPVRNSVKVKAKKARVMEPGAAKMGRQSNPQTKTRRAVERAHETKSQEDILEAIKRIEFG